MASEMKDPWNESDLRFYVDIRIPDLGWDYAHTQVIVIRDRVKEVKIGETFRCFSNRPNEIRIIWSTPVQDRLEGLGLLTQALSALIDGIGIVTAITIDPSYIYGDVVRNVVWSLT